MVKKGARAAIADRGAKLRYQSAVSAQAQREEEMPDKRQAALLANPRNQTGCRLSHRQETVISAREWPCAYPLTIDDIGSRGRNANRANVRKDGFRARTVTKRAIRSFEGAFTPSSNGSNGRLR